MAGTLADYINSTKDDLQAGILDSMLEDGESGGGGNLLKALPVGSINGLSATFTKINNEGPASGVGTRAINGAYPEGTVALYRESLTVGNYGGRILIDEALTFGDFVEGANPQTLQTQYKARLINRTVNNDIINGDKNINPNGLTGLRKWVDANQVLTSGAYNSASYSANGLVVKSTSTTRQDFLNLLDRLIRAVGGPRNPNVKLIMNYQARLALQEAVRSLNQFAITKDQYGRTVESYQDVEILDPGAKVAQETLTAATTDANMVIPNNFTYGSGPNNFTTEIWAIRTGLDNGVALYNTKPLFTRVIDRLEAGPQMAIEMGWYPALYPKIKNCIAKLAGVQVI